MKKRNMILAGVLAVSVSMSLAVPVLAEEEPSDFLDTIKAVGEQIKEAGTPLYEGIDTFLDTVKNEDGTVNWDKVGEKLNDLGSYFTGSEDGFDDLDAYLADYERINDAEKEYVLGTNEGLVPGDAQIFSKTLAYMDDDIYQDEIKILGDFTQQNFTIEDNQMNLCGASSVPMLLTVTREEDGSYIVKEAKQAEDGEGFAASVNAFCDEVGISKEEYNEAMEFCEYNDVTALIDYMDEYPEITGVEYMGEICTYEELKDISNAILDEMFPEEL